MELLKKILKYLGLAILLLVFWSVMPEGSTYKVIMVALGCELYTHKDW